MDLFQIIALLFVVTAAFSYINDRFLRLPASIGLMLMALVMSAAVAGMGRLGPGVVAAEVLAFLDSVDFSRFLLHGLLSFLLFAGALHVRMAELKRQKWDILSLAVIGTIIACVIIGTLTWFSLRLLGMNVSYRYALIFGAVVAPTDPISVLAIMKRSGLPSDLRTRIVGESLLNDGVAVAIFLMLLTGEKLGLEPDISRLPIMLAREGAGGVALGLVAGFAACKMLRDVHDYGTQVLITLALVTGSYALAEVLGVSGPLGVVAAGVLVGNYERHAAVSEEARRQLDTFWRLLDDIFNAVLFVLIGLEIMVVDLSGSHVAAALFAIPIMLFARVISVGLPETILRLPQKPDRHTARVVTIITWAGLRGGISVAMVLSLDDGPTRDTLLTMTYAIVVFTMFVQGLTLSRVAAWLKFAPNNAEKQHGPNSNDQPPAKQ
ncbi:MAG: sodium:proton antiporter [Planctomycetes bacterium]|nr:sodium:proton antiporter [Planctomycetota bacterium]